MMKRVDLTGVRFGKIVAVRMVMVRKGCCVWECRCDCGSTTCRTASYLRDRRRKIQTCGSNECLGRIQFEYRRKLRGMARFKEEDLPPSVTFFQIEFMQDLVEAFGPVEEEGFSNEQVDPSFYERWW